MEQCIFQTWAGKPHEAVWFVRILMSRKLPDGVQHAGGDALPPGQTEHPDPANPTESRLWDSGAAPGPVSLHEVILRHVFLLVC